MPSWSRKTIWIFVVLWTAVPFTFGDDGQTPDSDAVKNRITLMLQISGLGQEGFELEIRPAHPGCQFEPVIFGNEERLPLGAVARVNPIVLDVASTGADRDCSFAITIREPKKPPRTFLRGLRLTPPTGEEVLPTKTLRCYLSATALAAKDDPAKKRR